MNRKDKIKEAINKAKRKKEQSLLYPLEKNTFNESKINEAVSNQPKLPLTQPKKIELSVLQQKMQKKLSGAQFRWINEQLYTMESSLALDLMKEKPELFTVVLTHLFCQFSFRSIIKGFVHKSNHGH
jgi:ribosomal RNA-processing protein 8